ncbi:Holliday junction resolvase RuvX [Candidatus Kuenenbacteria bacterium]|nr:Holliday junction resolvase RuvX [Candidatus Kuenenbacteria bacterium]
MEKILGIDYGKSKIGLALADKQLKIAMPYKIIKNKGKKIVLQELKKICEQENVTQIVLGQPSQLTDNPEERVYRVNNQQIIMEIKKFFKEAKKFLKIPIDFENERMTTKMAKTLLKGSKIKDDDSVAAMIILQDYLEIQELRTINVHLANIS